ncbi:MAG TPA: ABC transporter ATP-binding protein [Acidobacterium sp.]|nr:ABC transporter ATP-binding protein [Acidobacterium sp.]
MPCESGQWRHCALNNESSCPILIAEDVRKSYENDAIRVLNGVNFAVHRGQTVALCGPSGCGKSTLLHLMGALDEPTTGRISVNGQWLQRGRSTLHLLRHQVGFVFQLHHLIPGLTLEENCLIPAVAAGTSHADARQRLLQLAERTGIAHRLKQPIQKLSGGERQRTALCRALMNRPGILLADEPTGALDEKTSAQIFSLLMELAQTEEITLVMATHDRSLARQCDRLVEMRDGTVVETSVSSEAK